MMKTMFQKFDEMNKLDIENGSKFIQVCPPQNVISVDKKGNHGEIKIGVPPEVPVDILAGKDLRIVLLIVDGKKYDSIK